MIGGSVIGVFAETRRIADSMEYEERLMRQEIEQESESANNGNSEKHTIRNGDECMPKTKRHRLQGKFEWKDEIVDTLILIWETKPVLYNVSDPQYHIKEVRRNAIMSIIQEMEDRNIYPLPSYEDVFKKLNALRTYFVAEKNKIEHSKVSGAGTSSIYKSKWQFYDSLMFLADFITPRSTQSNLQKCDQGIDERKIQNKPSSSRSKRNKSEELNQADQLIESGVDILAALKNKTKQDEQRRSQDMMFGELIGSTLEEIQPGPVKDMLKLEIQKLLFQAKYAHLQFSSGHRNNWNSGVFFQSGSPEVSGNDINVRSPPIFGTPTTENIQYRQQPFPRENYSARSSPGFSDSSETSKNDINVRSPPTSTPFPKYVQSRQQSFSREKSYSAQ